MKYLKRINETVVSDEVDAFQNEVEYTLYSLYEFLEDIGVQCYTDLIIHRFIHNDTDTFLTYTKEDIISMCNRSEKPENIPNYGIRLYFTLDSNNNDASRLKLSGEEMNQFTRVLTEVNSVRKKLDQYLVKLTYSKPLTGKANVFEVFIIKIRQPGR